MRGRKKKPIFDPGKRARRMARAILGTPPPERTLPSEKTKPTKHKKREVEREFES